MVAVAVLVGLVIGLVALIGLMCYVLYGLYITSQGPFYAPTSNERLQAVLKLAGDQAGKKAVDLGCGDGRVLIALAEIGAKGDGFDIDPFLVQKAKGNVRRAGLTQELNVQRRNFWDIDLGVYDTIVVYGIDRIMERLREKMWDECRDGTAVISVYFQFPEWEVDRQIGEVRRYRV